MSVTTLTFLTPSSSGSSKTSQRLITASTRTSSGTFPGTTSSSSFGTPTLSTTEQVVASIVTNTATESSRPHRGHREHQNGKVQTPFIVFIIIISSVGGLILLISLLRCSYSYFRTPTRDRVSNFISRHRLQREMEQRTREERRNRARWRGSLLEPPPPPYMHPPTYEGDPEEARPLNPNLSMSNPRAAWHASQPSLSLSYTSSHRDLYTETAMDVESSLGSGYAISEPVTSAAAPSGAALGRPQHSLSHSRHDSEDHGVGHDRRETDSISMYSQSSYHPLSQNAADEEGWRTQTHHPPPPLPPLNPRP